MSKNVAFRGHERKSYRLLARLTLQHVTALATWHTGMKHEEFAGMLGGRAISGARPTARVVIPGQMTEEHLHTRTVSLPSVPSRARTDPRQPPVTPV